MPPFFFLVFTRLGNRFLKRYQKFLSIECEELLTMLNEHLEFCWKSNVTKMIYLPDFWEDDFDNVWWGCTGCRSSWCRLGKTEFVPFLVSTWCDSDSLCLFSKRINNSHRRRWRTVEREKSRRRDGNNVVIILRLLLYLDPIFRGTIFPQSVVRR